MLRRRLLSSRRSRWNGLQLLVLHIDAAAEVSPFRNPDTRRDKIALDGTTVADVDFSPTP